MSSKIIIDVITDWEQFNQLRVDWDAVYAADPEAQLFLSWQWMSDWLTVHRGAWMVLAAKSDAADSRYVGFFPLRNRIKFDQHHGFYNEITLGGAQYSDYTGFIATFENENGIILAFGRHIKEKLYWAEFKMDNLLISDRRRQIFLSIFSESRFDRKSIQYKMSDGVDNSICPFIEVPPNWDNYLETLSANNRQKIRRLLRKVENSQEIRISFSKGEDIYRDLEILLKLWTVKWKPFQGDNAETIATRNYNMLSRCADHGTLLLPVFWNRGKIVAALAILIDDVKRSLLFLITGRDETYAEMPAGYLLHAYAIRYAIAHGFKEYDFLRGNERYKYLFARRERRLSAVSLLTRTRRNLGDKIHLSWLDAMLEKTLGFENAGKMADAERGYRHILEIAPDNALALYRFGLFLAKSGKHLEAKRMLSRSVQIEPEGDNAWLWLARSLQSLSEAEAALTACRQAIAFQPQNEDAKALLLQLSSVSRTASSLPAAQSATFPNRTPAPLDAEEILRRVALPDPLTRYNS